ncbi:hypothetical protein ACLOJK_011140 [Asimina triloba]
MSQNKEYFKLFQEWGDRSMLATIALGASQSPWGVAGGAIVGHLVATSVAILGGAFLANYISEKLVWNENPGGSIQLNFPCCFMALPNGKEQT